MSGKTSGNIISKEPNKSKRKYQKCLLTLWDDYPAERWDEENEEKTESQNERVKVWERKNWACTGRGRGGGGREGGRKGGWETVRGKSETNGRVSV